MAATPLQQRLVERRTPILDPWGESGRAQPASDARPRAPGSIAPQRAIDSSADEDDFDDESDVVTSAVPLSVALSRAPIPGQPTRPSKPRAAPPAVPAAAQAAAASRPPPAPSIPPKRSLPPPAPPARPAVAAAHETPSISLDHVERFADVPRDARAALLTSGQITNLEPGDEALVRGATLMLEGSAVVSSAIVDAPARRIEAGAVVSARGSLPERSAVALRVVASSSGARVLAWDQATLDEALMSCSWVLDELRDAADELQAFAGATMGALGDLPEASRNQALARLEVRVLAPNEPLIEQGASGFGFHLVGAGSVQITDPDASESQPGEVLFLDELLGGAQAPWGARAGAGGALLLSTDRHGAHEMILSMPPLLDALSR